MRGSATESEALITTAQSIMAPAERKALWSAES